MKFPVHRYEGKWWFWDEIGVDRIGPYESPQEAKNGLDFYCACLDGQNEGNLIVVEDREIKKFILTGFPAFSCDMVV